MNNIIMIAGITLYSSSGKEYNLSNDKDVFVKEFSNVCRELDRKYSIYIVPQTDLEKAKNIQIIVFAFDTNNTKVTLAIDKAQKFATNLMPCLNRISKTSHYVITPYDLISDDFISFAKDSWKEKYGKKLIEHDLFGFVENDK